MLKRALESELALVRIQKSRILFALETIDKQVDTQCHGSQPCHDQFGSDQMWKDCAKIVETLLQNQNVKIHFGEPVRADLYPRYYDMIKTPMDLGTIQKKLDTGYYTNVYDFRDDVRLCFENCRIFNPPNTVPRFVGDKASKLFENQWIGIENKIENNMNQS